MLQNSPGGVGWESAPFKLTAEYVDLMDGPDSDYFEMFRSLLQAGLIEIRKNLDELLTIINIMMKGKQLISSYSCLSLDSKMPCFKRPATLQKEIEERISTKDIIKENKRDEFYELSDRLVKASLDNWRTV